MHKLPQLTPFNVKEQQFYSNSFGMSELLTLSPQVSTATVQRKLNSKLMTIGQGWNIDRLVYGELRLLAQLLQCLHY